ncbi:DUF7563 family protein [Natronorubrum texcoconense]|uniref:Small CPxCG-related zinc finger protein n=1 Tax=Natronorubrum texcoconense TaxID=1095776 RepID=A0A1G9HCE9_9EURY|nr:hypothetical protein [Natronorubrum texcoconense]SDL10173.1 hypothetical protein SAMN04515672_0182 [Natronorubrum texcoconense]
MSTDRPQWTPTAGTTTNACQNCGSHVTPQYVRGYGTNDGRLCHCPNCDGIAVRDMRHGAGRKPDYDPAVDRIQTSDQHPIFPQRGDDR